MAQGMDPVEGVGEAAAAAGLDLASAGAITDGEALGARMVITADMIGAGLTVD